jgi:hypothetical protein
MKKVTQTQISGSRSGVNEDPSLLESFRPVITGFPERRKHTRNESNHSTHQHCHLVTGKSGVAVSWPPLGFVAQLIAANQWWLHNTAQFLGWSSWKVAGFVLHTGSIKNPIRTGQVSLNQVIVGFPLLLLPAPPLLVSPHLCTSFGLPNNSLPFFSIHTYFNSNI